MESELVVELVADLFACRNPLTDLDEIASEVGMLGMTIADLKANPDLLFEAGIARNFRRACAALDIPISPHQSLTLAKHMTVGADQYRNGVPLSDHERTIALRLKTIHFKALCAENDEPFTEEHARDCERSVNFGERGLTVGHKIGEASGCFQVLLLLGLSAAIVIAFV